MKKVSRLSAFIAGTAILSTTLVKAEKEEGGGSGSTVTASGGTTYTCPSGDSNIGMSVIKL